MHFAGRNALLEKVNAGWCMLWQDEHGSEDTLPRTEGYLAFSDPIAVGARSPRMLQETGGHIAALCRWVGSGLKLLDLQ